MDNDANGVIETVEEFLSSICPTMHWNVRRLPTGESLLWSIARRTG